MGCELLTAWERELRQWHYNQLERRCVDNLCHDLPAAKAVVGHVWQLAGLPGKPLEVVLVGKDHPEYIPGPLAYWDSLNLFIGLQRDCSTVVVLHEMAHVLTENPLDGLELRPLVEREMHGPVWLQNFLWLLDRCMGSAYNGFYLRSTMPALLSPMTIPMHPKIWGEDRRDLA